MKKSLLDKLESLLKNESAYCADDGTLLKNKIAQDASQFSPSLLKLLLSDNDTKNAFFAESDGITIFNSMKFAQFLSSKNFLPDSYTSYKNKIGLNAANTTGGGYSIFTNQDVVLDFPYKDCILEGGQTKDDQKRTEIFYNEILAPEQVTNLLAPKAFCNAKRYDANGEHKIDSISQNDNLIIKGNNLIALSCLLERYRGKVKCIYIDPPYNTGSDSFGYNDNFNHSTWLVFMKNRLELARKLLRDDGAIWVSSDDREFAYLKVLMDEIFGKDNFLNDVVWNSTKSVTNTAIISVSHTHNFVYFKNKDWWIENRTEFRIPENGEGFSNPDNDPRGPWKADPFQVGGWRPNQQYKIKNPKTGEIYLPNEDCSWKNDYTKFQELIKDNRIIFGTTGDSGPQRKRFLSEALERGKVVKTIWDDIDSTTNATQHNKKMFGKITFSNPKPEELLQRILQLSTNPSDIVLDFHLGSGTTAAVAHKMGRQYIGVEQMDYIQTIAVERLKKVIAGEQGGISKTQNWQGGGSFVYCELASLNASYIERISSCETESEIVSLIEEILQSDFVSSAVLPSKIDTNAADFKELSFDDKKKFALEILDKNLLYINEADIEDESANHKTLEMSDKEFTKSFYGKDGAE